VPAARFCGSCGVGLGAAVADELAGSAPEFKHVTVLFADIVSSTQMVAAMDAEQAMDFLAPVVDAMVHAVMRYGGTIGRTLGDGVMALFGAPQAREGHALLACQAAIELHASTARFPGIHLRVGLHSGEVVIDASLDAPDSERRLHGATIHLASRIIAMADPGSTFLTGDTFALARSHYDAQAVGLREARGFEAPVQVYRLTGPRRAFASDLMSLQGVARTPLYGRERELAQLQQALAEAAGGSARIVGLVGAPGTGKSRLCAEFASRCRSRHIPVFEARAQLYGHATPLQPVLEFLRSAVLEVAPGDDAAMVRLRIAQHVRAMGEPFEQDGALLAEFLGVAPEGAQAPGGSAPSRRARLLHVVGQMVRRLATGTTVIVIEDLHWLDAASSDFLVTLTEALAGSPTLLLVNYRPGYSAPWMASAGFGEIALRDLEQDDVARLVAELLGHRPQLRELAHRIAQRSGGNPFFAEELVRALSTEGTLVGSAPLPSTVQSVIGARIDQLSEARKSLLQLCAIVGKDFPAVVLERVTPVKPKELRRQLDELCTAEFLVPLGRGAVDWYSFRHPLIQEVAYRTQLKQRRATLHALVARAMQAFYESWGDEFAGLVAYHFEAAGQELEAAHHAARAAAWISATDIPQAIRQWQHVRELMQHQPDTPDNNLLRSRASTQIAWLGWREGVTAEAARPLIDEALAWARVSDPRIIPLLLLLEGRIHMASGGAADHYADRVHEALRMPGGHDQAGRRATLHAALSQALGWGGLLKEALEANTAALEEVHAIEPFDEQFLGYRVEHWAISLRARILMRMARFDQARECLARMLSIERRALDPTVRFIAHMGSLEMASALGETGPALEHAQQVAAIAAEHPNAYLRVFALAAQGLSATIRGDLDAALAAYGDSLASLRASRAAMEYESELLASLAECHLRSGHRAAALETAMQALAVAQAQTTRLPQCRALLVLAVLAMESELPDGQEPQSLLARAEQLIERTGAAIYLPQLDAARARIAVSRS
jgi:class 3 adenylate cyclase/tetratricopeptide (TPR) repeat protein